MVYNGKPARKGMPRDNASSPTASLESVMLTGVIDAHEKRNVMTAVVPNAFTQEKNARGRTRWRESSNEAYSSVG